MPDPLFAEIWEGDLDPTPGHVQAGYRPVLVISDDLFNSGGASLVIVLPLTTNDRRVYHHYQVDPPEGGLRRRSYIMCEGVRSVAKERLSARVGKVSNVTMEEVAYRLRRLMCL